MSHAKSSPESEPLTLVEGIRSALHAEMERDETVIVLGQDVGKNGGVFRATEGLYDEFGGDRVLDTPLAESGIVGSSIGLALSGLKPVPEIQFMGFIYPAFDQIVSHVARIRSRTQGKRNCQIVIRAPYGGGIRAPEHHSESKEAFFVHEPGLKVVIPSTPHDAKGLLIASIRDSNPVIFLEPKRIYRSFRQDVPSESYEVPLGEACVRRAGKDISVFTWGAMTRPTMAAAEAVANNHDIEAEVIDLRSLSPLDLDLITESFKRTGRAVIVHEGPRTGGVGAEICTTIQETALVYQEAPIKRVTGFDAPMPLYALEDFYLPQKVRIVNGILEAANF